MIATRIGPDWRLMVVGSPAYFARHAAPATPHGLTGHACINIRPRPAGAYLRMGVRKGWPGLQRARSRGKLVFNSTMHVLQCGARRYRHCAYVPEELVAPYLADGRLREILPDWCPHFQGYHLYYPNRRQASPAFSAFVEAFRLPAKPGLFESEQP